MAINTRLGKAFEFACIKSLYSHFINHQEVVINQTNAFINAKNCYKMIANIELKNDLDRGANAAARVIISLEPQLNNPIGNTPLYLLIQEDAAGIAGDVRDILCIRKQNNWGIGLSCKHNHAAVKHSRLSPYIDFGEQWIGIPCSQEYFNEINPLFCELTELKKRKKLWRDLEKKEKRFYIPLLQAFIKELNRLDKNNPNLVPQRLLHYLLGRKDFYKIISHDRKQITQVQSFNIYGSLNKTAGGIRPIVKTPQLNMPTRFFNIDLKPESKNTLLVVCDNGWTISMRIHNARSLVEPSLKFDICLIGVPTNLYTQFEPW